MLWLLFSAGGMLVALLVPVLLLLFGMVFPLGWVAPPDHGTLAAVFGNWLVRLVLLALCVLALFHWAHRFRYLLFDTAALKPVAGLVNTLCFAGVAIGSVAAAYYLLVA